MVVVPFCIRRHILDSVRSEFQHETQHDYFGPVTCDGTAHGIHRAVYRSLGDVIASDVLFDFRLLNGSRTRVAGIARHKGAVLPEGFASGRITVRIRPLLHRGASEVCATDSDGAITVARRLFEKNGAQLNIVAQPIVEVLRYRDTSNGSFPFYTAIINGHVQVTDREKFQCAYSSGLGRGKAFGCGMVVIL